jgi:hypothetical protein
VIRTTAIIQLVLLSSLVACAEPSEPPPAPGQDDTPTVSDPTPDGTEDRSWEALLGVRLRSVQTYSGGLGEDGPVQGYQHLTLHADGRFDWEVADFSLGGTYRRNGNRITARGDGREFRGELDLERGVLTWSGIEFEIP